MSKLSSILSAKRIVFKDKEVKARVLLSPKADSQLDSLSCIQNLTTKSIGTKFTTQEMKEKASAILSPKAKVHIDRLGVKSRYFAKAGHESITEYCRQLVKETLEDHKVTNLVVASEISDYQTPGLAPLLVNSIGDNFVNVFNLQGTACSSMPKTLKLCENLKGDTLVLINGITSPMYQKTLDDLIQKNETVVSKSDDWVALIFAFLFGDGITSFIHSDTASSRHDYKFKHLGQITNINTYDYKNGYVDNQLFPHASKNIMNIALQYTDALMEKLKIENLSDYDKIILHTGRQKIIDAYKQKYNLDESQVESSRFVLEHYGNLTGCSLPFVLQNTGDFKKALMIGISMGVSVDMVEVFNSE